MIAALAVVAVLLGAWELYVAVSGVDPLVLPAPTDVARALVDDRALLWDNLVPTATEIGLGVLLALAIGAGLAVGLHFVPRLRRAVYPLLVASQAIPVAVVAPVLVVWLGFGVGPKLVIVALVCFFPVVVTTLDALRRVEPERRKLLRTLDASRWQVFRWAEAPAALPGALSGAKIAVAIAAIAAVLAEDTGTESGIGLVIRQAGAYYETARAYAAVVLLAAFALLLFAALHLAERRLAPWAHPQGERTS
jgi:ABC-type nitrate/sulfonate/bicarbonate transport system permease component